MVKKNCVIYTHYTFGIGHLQRAKVIANSLKKDFNVTLISSGAKLKNFKMDDDINWIKLLGEVK
jgi:predicted glycosyltransferase